MSSISSTAVTPYFQTYDRDKNGSLDRAEIAQASLDLMNQNDPQAQTAGRLFATFVQGGKSGQGLLPDQNGDGMMSLAEFQQLAGADGDASTISSADFQAAFPTSYQPGGATGSMDGLKQIAAGQSANPQSPSGASNNILSMLGQVVLPLLQIFQQVLTFAFSNGGSTQAQTQ